MKRVLFVDNDEGVTEAKKVFRNQFGTQLLFARNITAAIEIIHTHDIGLVISGKDLHQHIVPHWTRANFVDSSAHNHQSLVTVIQKFLTTLP